jgi:hypothetical protein
MARKTVALLAALGLVAGCGDDDSGGNGGDGPEVVLEDDFSDPESGFTISENETGFLAYVDGAYVIESLGVDSLKVSDTDLDGEAFLGGLPNLEDVRIEADVEKVHPGEPVVMGLMCRLDTQPAVYYSGTFDDDGSWQITRFEGGPAVLLASTPETQVAGLAEPGSDRLGFECVDGVEGTTLTLTINGTEVGTVTDPDPLPSGRAAMVAGPRAGGTRGTVRFDDLVVTSL